MRQVVPEVADVVQRIPGLPVEALGQELVRAYQVQAERDVHVRPRRVVGHVAFRRGVIRDAERVPLGDDALDPPFLAEVVLHLRYDAILQRHHHSAQGAIHEFEVVQFGSAACSVHRSHILLPEINVFQSDPNLTVTVTLKLLPYRGVGLRFISWMNPIYFNGFRLKSKIEFN